jgi:hypothetical protein
MGSKVEAAIIFTTPSVAHFGSFWLLGVQILCPLFLSSLITSLVLVSMPPIVFTLVNLSYRRIFLLRKKFNHFLTIN